MVHEVTEGFETSSTTKKAYINCMSMKTSKDLMAICWRISVRMLKFWKEMK